MKGKKKPLPYSMGCGGYTILYKCPKCEMKFNLATPDWNFCPHCGQPLDWSVIVRANEEWRKEFCEHIDDDAYKQKMLDEVNSLNQTITDGRQYSMKQTPATRKAILRSNIQYYLGNGWTKEELIKQGRFTEEDFAVME